MLGKIKVLMGNRCNFLLWQVNASRYHGKNEIIACCSNLASSLCGISVYYCRPALMYSAEGFRVSVFSIYIPRVSWPQEMVELRGVDEYSPDPSTG